MNWSSDDNIKISYRLLNVKGFGCAQANKLLWALSSTVQTSSQLENGIKQSLKPQDITAFDTEYTLYRTSTQINYVSVLDDISYPSKLRDSLRHNSPTVLSIMGNANLLHKKCVGISGSRKVSPKGLWITNDCASQLAENDICVVSGYASGVDIEAHKTALSNNGSTIIVLPEGISTFYIRKELRDIWDWDRVLVISEFLPKDKWLASRAMKRNQTIIGLSDSMIVIEAGETGGSLDAGLKTILSGKSLFVPYYKETPLSAAGNNLLIQKGAYPLGLGRDSHRTNIEKLMTAIYQPQTLDL